MNSDTVYLDYAAATPVDERVMAAMLPFFGEKFYNPSSPYAPAVEVRHDYEAAKQRIAECIGAKGSDIIMTAGATESINLMFAGVTGHVVTTAIEHIAVLAAARLHEHSLVAVDSTGRVAAADVRAAIREDTVLVSISLANNEIGTIQPLRDISEVIQEVKRERHATGNQTPLYFHSDASQGAGLCDINVARLGVDALTLNAAKLYGPKQVGLLWIDSHVRLNPLIVGGGQERGLRSGTEQVAGTVGFALALELAVGGRKSEVVRLGQLRDMMQSRLIKNFPGAVISGNQRHRLANYLSISFPNIDAERIVFLLEAKGVFVATGSACAANKGTRSHVLTALGLDPSVADGSLRITLGRGTDKLGCERALEYIVGAVLSERTRMDR